MAEPFLAKVAEQLSSLRVSGWAGTPSGLEAGPLEDPPALVTLGTAREEAELVNLVDPLPGASARAWLRNGRVVLVEVSWRRRPPLDALADLGEPDERGDVDAGLDHLVGGEWLFPGRGLTAVVDPEGGHIRHLLGFAPTTAERYRRMLRPDLATRRRPPQATHATEV
jgi:hypothetical protein